MAHSQRRVNVPRYAIRKANPAETVEVVLSGYSSRGVI